jgi:outer membrane receptor protein involved in Fe transport
MTVFRRLCCGALIAALIGMPPALAQTVTSATISGTIADSQGGAIAGAAITATGPTTSTVTSDVHGAYKLTLKPGIYTLNIAHAGYQPITYPSVALVDAQQLNVNFAMTAASLTTLQEIGHVVAHSGTGPVLNTSAAATNVVSGQVFVDQAQSQVGPILDQIPGIVASYDGSGENAANPGAQTYAQIRGATRNETATLLDGHPLAVINGGYLLQTLNGAVFQDIELVKGPGAMSPSISNAIGGTVNFRTVDPTPDRETYISWGADTYGGESFAFRQTGSLDHGKLGYALVYTTNGTPGAEGTMEVPWIPASGSTYIGSGLIVSPTVTANTKNSAYANGIQTGTTQLYACCAQVANSFTDRAQLLKLRYRFSGSTIATVSYVGFQSFQDFNGAHLAEANPIYTPGTGGGYIPGGPTANEEWPAYVGIANVGQYAYDFEPVFQAEVSTTIKDDTLLARYYGAGLSRPAYNGVACATCGYTSTNTLYGTAQLQMPNGTTQWVTFNGAPETVTEVATGCDLTAQLCTNPALYEQVEQDRMGGASLEYNHFVDNATDGVYTFSADFNRAIGYSSRLDRIIAPSQPWGTGQSDLALMARANLDLTPKLNFVWSNYFDAYNTIYSTDGGLTWNDQEVNHFDTRLGLAYRQNSRTSYRFSAGSALSPPTLGEIGTTAKQATCAVGEPYATEQIANAISPETSFGYDLGASYLIGKDRQTVLDADLYRTDLFGQIMDGSYDTGQTIDCGANNPVPLYDSEYLNLSRARYEGAELSLRRDPDVGWGYTANLALIRGYPFDIPASLYSNGTVPYSGNLAIVPDVNYLPSGDGSGGAVTGLTAGGLPYSTGYGEIHFRTPHHDMFAFGATYLGPNNSYNRPAFFIARATARFSLDSKGITALQLSGYNIFNVYNSVYYLQDQGIPEVLVNGKLGYTNANSVGPARYTLTVSRKF